MVNYQRGTMRENAMAPAETIETKGPVIRRFVLSIIFVLLTFSATASGPQQDAGSIRGTVVDENNVAVAGALVNADPLDGRPRGSLIRYVETDASGHFLIDRLGWGRYRIFAKKEASAYPETRFSFYDSGGIPEATITQTSPTADAQIRLGPKAGILTGSVTNAETAAPVNAAFKLIRTTSTDHWFSTSQGTNYRVLLPSATDVLVEVSSPGYKTWTSSGPLILQAGAEMHLNISLEVSRDPSLPVYQFLVPDGYVGWLRLEGNVKDAPSVGVENKLRIFKFTLIGVLATSSAVPEEAAEKRYLYYSENRSTREIPTDYRHGRGMIWGEAQGYRGGVLSQFYFFVGTEEQYQKQGYRGVQGATPATSSLDVNTPDSR